MAASRRSAARVGNTGDRQSDTRGERMTAGRESRGGIGGISIGGILVIIGIVVMIVWGFWIGLVTNALRAYPLRRLRAGQVVLIRALFRLPSRPMASDERRRHGTASYPFRGDRQG